MRDILTKEQYSDITKIATNDLPEEYQNRLYAEYLSRRVSSHFDYIVGLCIKTNDTDRLYQIANCLQLFFPLESRTSGELKSE